MPHFVTKPSDLRHLPYTDYQCVEIVKALRAMDVEADTDDCSLLQAQLIGLMEGEGAPEDHRDVKAALAGMGLTPAGADLVHGCLVNILSAKLFEKSSALLPVVFPAAEPVAEVKELFTPATGATAKAAHLMDTSLPGGTMLYTAPPAPTEQWRDIETAPQDGTRVILAEAEKVFHGGFVGVQFKEHRDADGNYLDQTDADAYWLNFEDGDVCHPTHWKPEPALPAPPQGAAKGDGNGL